MYDQLHVLMKFCLCLNTSHNFFDKSHLSQKEWLDTFVNNVKDKHARSILNSLFETLANLFDYVEAKNEITLNIKHYNKVQR